MSSEVDNDNSKSNHSTNSTSSSNSSISSSKPGLFNLLLNHEWQNVTGKSEGIQHVALLARQLKHQYETQQFCDIELEVIDSTGPNVIHCHKLILSVCSGYLRDFIKHVESLDHIEDNPKRITVHLEDKKRESVQEAIAFLYDGKCLIDQSNLKELIDISLMWEIKNLFEECFTYIRNYKTLPTACLYYELAKKYQHISTVEELSYYIRENFEKLQKLMLFNELSLDSFTEIIKHDEINVKSEDTIYHGLFLHIQLRKIKASFDGVRFEHLSEKTLNHLKLRNPFIYGAEKDENLLLGQSYHQLKCQLKLPVPKFAPRSWIKKQNQIICIGSNRRLCVYNESSKTWEYSVAFPNWVDDGTTVQIAGSKLIIVGSLNPESNNKAAIFHLIDPIKTETIPQLKTGISGPGVAYYCDHLYLFGGMIDPKNDNMTQLNTVNRIVVTKINRQWKKVTPMATEESFQLTVLHNGLVFMIGGSFTRRSVKMYNPATCEWLTLADLPDDANSLTSTALVFERQIHVVNDNYVMQYNIANNFWHAYVYEDVGTIKNAFVYNNAIWSLVDQDGSRVFKSFDFQTVSWQLENSIEPPSISDVNYVYSF